MNLIKTTKNLLSTVIAITAMSGSTMVSAQEEQQNRSDKKAGFVKSEVLASGYAVNLVYIDIKDKVSGSGIELNYTKAVDIIPREDSESDVIVTPYMKLDYRIAGNADNEQIKQQEFAIGMNVKLSDTWQSFIETSGQFEEYDYDNISINRNFDIYQLGANYSFNEDLGLSVAIEYRDGSKSDFGYSLTMTSSSKKRQGLNRSFGVKRIGDELSAFINFSHSF